MVGSGVDKVRGTSPSSMIGAPADLVGAGCLATGQNAYAGR